MLSCWTVSCPFALMNPSTELCSMSEKLKNSKPDLSVLKDYRKREEEFLRRAADLEEVTKLRDAKKAEYDSLRKQRLDEFMTGFNTISLKLKEMYQVRWYLCTHPRDAELPVDDHTRRQRRARTGRQYGPLLRGHHLQCDASEEKLEEYLQPVWRREGSA